MIAFNAEYYRPDSLNEAVNLYNRLNSMNKAPLYYSGGTEIITFARVNRIFTKAIIDIKGISECNIFKIKNNKWNIGAAIPLTQVAENKTFPLLSETSKFPADHTARNKITVIGNICGSIIYKEAILGHLVADSTVVIYGPRGKRRVPINRIFHEKLQLEKGELVVQTITDLSYAKLPCLCVKKTKQGKGGYPLISMAAARREGAIRMAFSGVCGFPFRSQQMEADINNKSVPKQQRIEEAILHVPGPILNDIQGSAEYRKLVLYNLLQEVIEMEEKEA